MSKESILAFPKVRAVFPDDPYVEFKPLRSKGTRALEQAKAASWFNVGWTQENSTARLFLLNLITVSLFHRPDHQRPMMVQFDYAPNCLTPEAPGTGQGWFSRPVYKVGFYAGLKLKIQLMKSRNVPLAGGVFLPHTLEVRDSDLGQGAEPIQWELARSYFNEAKGAIITDLGHRLAGGWTHCATCPDSYPDSNETVRKPKRGA